MTLLTAHLDEILGTGQPPDGEAPLRIAFGGCPQTDATHSVQWSLSRTGAAASSLPHT